MNETCKFDHIKLLITLTSDYIKRLSLYFYCKYVCQLKARYIL